MRRFIETRNPMPEPMRRWTKILGISLASVLAGWLALGYVAAYVATLPRSVPIPQDYALAGNPVENLWLTSADNVRISAWRAGSHGERAVILLSGIIADRRQNIGRAEFFLEQGFDVLLPDLRGTGMSNSAPVTMGWKERYDLKACYQYLRDRGYKHIGAYGLSLGAATIVYSFPEINDYAFVILESCYDTIDHALTNRMDMVKIPHFIAWPMRWWSRWRMGVGEDQLRPVDYMPYCNAPVLILAGDSEIMLKVSETLDLYNRCASPDKRLHIFDGGTHSRLAGEFPDEYKRSLREFIEKVSANWT